MSTSKTGTARSSQEVADRIMLTLPGNARLRGVATLVLGGVGSRLDLPYEKVDDLQLAVLSVLAAADVDTITIDVGVDEDQVAVSVGPIPEGGAADPGLRRVLERLVDSVEASRRGEGDASSRKSGGEEWITLLLARSS